MKLPDMISQGRCRIATGLDMAFLEAGRPSPGENRPLVLLLHGFPELAYSWRHVLPALSDAGFWAVAPDQRGYGATTGHADGYDTDLSEFTLRAIAADALALIAALGQRSVFAVVGHDFGSPVAMTCAVTRPDVFHRLVMMSAPSAPPPALPRGDAEVHGPSSDVHADLKALERPRKHYQWYYSERAAASDMMAPPEGLHAFLRAYYHVKSADWAQNKPHQLSGWTADALAQMPTYYVMDAGDTMPEAVRPHLPSPTEIAAAGWLSDADLDVYVRAFQTTGFQPALNWYRCRTEGVDRYAHQLFAGAPITVPATFIAGRQDWGIEQVPGARARMEAAAQDWRGTTLIDGAGHWVQQEKPAETTSALLAFLNNNPSVR